MGLKTPLYEIHRDLGAKIVDFGGWDMPVHYGSQIEEHHAVREHAGAFDVSHMTVVELHGSDVAGYLDRLLANDFGRLKRPGQAMYSAMLNDAGGILDDLIVYDTGNPSIAVVNCATREKDLEWMTGVAGDFAVDVIERPDLAIVAVQGPAAIDITTRVVTEDRAAVISELKVFQGAWCNNWFVARTGYTGEKGLEILLPGDEVTGFWTALLEAGVRPIGLGARDTLRLEAGMNLYGTDMDESVTPFAANMGSTVYLEGRDFIGAEALRSQQQAGGIAQLVGLIMKGKGVLRHGYRVYCGEEDVGEVTSGAFSPTLGHSVAFARVTRTGKDMKVEIRGKRHDVMIVTTPFVRNGKPVYKEESPTG